MARPLGVAMRARKPWVRALLILLGWYVLFIKLLPSLFYAIRPRQRRDRLPDSGTTGPETGAEADAAGFTRLSRRRHARVAAQNGLTPERQNIWKKLHTRPPFPRQAVHMTRIVPVPAEKRRVAAPTGPWQPVDLPQRLEKFSGSAGRRGSLGRDRVRGHNRQRHGRNRHSGRGAAVRHGLL